MTKGVDKISLERLQYHPSYAAELPDMFLQGESVYEVCAKIGISVKTFYNWRKEHEEFAEAYELGKTYAVAWWMTIGRLGATGQKKVNSRIWALNMINRAGWRSNNTQHTLQGAEADKPKSIPVGATAIEAADMYSAAILGNGDDSKTTTSSDSGIV